jgi:hypothetical protein
MMTTNSNAGSSPVDRKVMPHTPGPWVVAAGDNYRIEAAAIPAEYPHHFPGDDLGRMVATVGNRQPDFGVADAALIAAAPDLLEALRDMVSDHECMSEATLRFARAAIAKATDHEA